MFIIKKNEEPFFLVYYHDIREGNTEPQWVASLQKNPLQSGRNWIDQSVGTYCNIPQKHMNNVRIPQMSRQIGHLHHTQCKTHYVAIP